MTLSLQLGSDVGCSFSCPLAQIKHRLEFEFSLLKSKVMHNVVEDKSRSSHDSEVENSAKSDDKKSPRVEYASGDEFEGLCFSIPILLVASKSTTDGVNVSHSTISAIQRHQLIQKCLQSEEILNPIVGST